MADGLLECGGVPVNQEVSITSLLMSWGMPPDVLKTFDDEKIDIEVLPYLTDEIIEKLIPNIGPCIKFKVKLNSYKASFALSASGDIQPSLAVRCEKLKKFGLTLQPQAVVVGPAEENITHSYVVIDTLMYEVQSPMKAIDIVFKSFHSLHAHYPPEAENIWTFLQIAVYDVRSKWDKQLSSVNSLFSEYKNFSFQNEHI